MLPAIHRRRVIPTQWSPMSDYEDLYERMGRLMGATLGEPSQLDVWTPLADVTETTDSYNAEIEIPGLTKDDIEIHMDGNELIVTGESRKEEKAEEKGKRTHHRTRRHGRFEYRTLLPNDIDPERVSANLKHGVLHLTIPKSDQNQSRRIAIDQE